MPDGVPSDIDARLNELKNAVYYLSELVQRQAAPPGLEKISGMAQRMDELSTLVEALDAKLARMPSREELAAISKKLEGLPKPEESAALGGRVDKLADSLGWVARQSSELSTLLKSLDAKTAGLPSKDDFSLVTSKLSALPKPEESRALIERIDKLADSLGWVARQSSELSAASGSLSQKLEGLPTRDQFAQWSRTLSTSVEASAAESVSKVDALQERLNSLDRLSQSFDAISKQNLLMSQNLDALNKRTSDLSGRIEAIPTREQMGQFAAMVESKLGEVSGTVSQEIEQRLTASAQKAEQQMAVIAGEFKNVSAGVDKKLDSTLQRVDSQLASSTGELKKVSESLDARLAPIVQMQEGFNRFAGEYSKTNQSLGAIHEQFEFQKKQAEALAEALTIVHRDLNHESETLAELDKKTNALGEALATVGAASTDTASKLASLESSAAQTAQETGQLSSETQALFGKFESLAQNTAAASSALSSRTEEATARLAEQQKALETLTGKVNDVYNATAQAHQALAASLAESGGQLEKGVAELTRASDQLSSRLEQLEKLSSLTEKEESETIAALRDVSAQVETHRKQGEMFGTGLESLRKDMAGQFSAADERTQAALKGSLSAQAAQLQSAVESVNALRADLEAQRKETGLIVDALTSLVKEVSHMEAELSQNKVEPGKLYADMEKKFLARLSEKLTHE